MKIFSRENSEETKRKKENWKIKKQEIKQRRKEEIRQKRESRKEEYADAPFLTRFCHVNARRIKVFFAVMTAMTVSLTVLGICLAEPFGIWVNTRLSEYRDKLDKSELMPEEVYELSPIDEEGAARIAALPSNNADDTWTFCVYIVGSNLEDVGENDLSPYVQMITAETADEIAEADRSERYERISRYASEINANGLDVPEYLYKIQKPIASSIAVTEDVIVAEEKGCASDDISEMCTYELPDNITIVLQTGGATRWSNTLVNPNKTQRFVIKNGIMSEVANMHIQDSCDPDTMADFISFCADNYQSDHMAMILWDHGGGALGFGMDSIFNSGMTLADLHTAFSKALKKNIHDPYFDFIGFDACLMAATDTAVALDGYGKYLVASEEVEPGFGWDYAPWLKALADDPTMNAAAVGRAIADTYMNFYMRQNQDSILQIFGSDSVITFSVADMHKAALTDAAYEAMNEKFLKLAVDDPSVLADMTRAAKRTMRYAQASYKYYNTIDLGTYLDYLSVQYPEECAEVRAMLKDAVLYKRSYSYLDGSQGLSIYFPVNMDEAYCLTMFTDYIYNVSAKKSTNALYYYKAAGCLNDEMKEYVERLTGKSMKTLDTQMFYDYQRIIPEIRSNDQIVIPVGEELENHIQDVYIEFAAYDEDENTLTYYGTDDCYDYDGDGNIVAEVDGTWFALDGSLLDARFSFETDTTSTYVATVLYNGEPSYMTFTLNYDNGEIKINSIAKIPEGEDPDYASTLKTTTELLPGDTIVPVIYKQDVSGQESYTTEGKKVKYKGTSKIELIDLPEGDYLQTVVITDMRGDQYYSPVVEAHFKNGKASGLKVNPEFVGKN